MHPLLDRIRSGDRRAVARALTILENGGADKLPLLRGLYPFIGQAHVVGVTGAPGAGKSTLVDQIIRVLRASGTQVGVLAVDPSSPFSGGALLGDRVRMAQHSGDAGVYIRSMSSRGSPGGLAQSTGEMLYALAAYGCDVILIETVGVGQAELDIMSVADTVALVLTPGSGDHVQTAKAGIMEIADVFVVNKCELPGADALLRELQLMLHERVHQRDAWTAPVVATSAVAGDGMEPLLAALDHHRRHLQDSGVWAVRHKRRRHDATLRILEGVFHRYLTRRAQADQQWQRRLDGDGDEDPYMLADRLLADLPWLML